MNTKMMVEDLTKNKFCSLLSEEESASAIAIAIAMDDLPEDIIFNIFSRIPLTPLFRFRSVSKLWCKLIDHPSLANMHHHYQQHPIPIPISLSPTKHTTGLHLVQRNLLPRVPTLCPTQLPILNFDFKSSWNNYSFGSCNGLVYFAQHMPAIIISVYVSNPLRRQCHKLPPPHTNFIPAAASVKTYGLGFDCSTNTFKMVCVFFREKTHLGTIVLTLGTSSWREISQVPPCPISGTPVFSHGFLHWKVDPCFVDHDNVDAMIVSFDVRNEAFKFFTHPPELHLSLFQLVDYNGNLAIAEQTCRGEVRIWVMKDYDQKLWVRECCIPIKFDERVEVISLGKNGELLLSTRQGMFFSYSSKTGLKFTHVMKFQPYPMIYSFTGSLFSVNNICNGRRG